MKKSTKLSPIEFNEDNHFLKINGVECFAIIFENEHTHRYTGYKLIENDIDFCLHFIKNINEQSVNPHNFTLPLSLALVTLYGKIFAKADGRGVKFQRNDIPREFHETHDLVTNYRNNFVAHAGGTHEIGITVVGLNPNNRNKKVLCVLQPQIVKVDAINPQVRENLTQILLALKKESQSRQATIYELIKNSVLNIDIDELYQSFKNVYDSPPEPIMKPGNYSTHFHIEPNSKMSFRVERSP